MSKSDPCDCGTPFEIHTLENPQCSVSHPQQIKPSEQNKSPREQLKLLDLDRFIPDSEEIFCMVKCAIHQGKNGKIV
jgi:hypothetical protein